MDGRSDFIKLGPAILPQSMRRALGRAADWIITARSRFRRKELSILGLEDIVGQEISSLRVLRIVRFRPELAYRTECSDCGTVAVFTHRELQQGFGCRKGIVCLRIPKPQKASTEIGVEREKDTEPESQPEQRPRATCVGMDQRHRTVGGRDAFQDNGLRSGGGESLCRRQTADPSLRSG